MLRGSGHHTPALPGASCCFFLSWDKTLPAQTPWWDRLASSSSWDAVGCRGNLTPSRSSTINPSSPQPPAATQEGPSGGRCHPTDHHVPVHLPPKPACSPPSLLLHSPLSCRPQSMLGVISMDLHQEWAVPSCSGRSPSHLQPSLTHCKAFPMTSPSQQLLLSQCCCSLPSSMPSCQSWVFLSTAGLDDLNQLFQP